MNILVLLIPKSQVEFVEDTFTIRQTIEKNESSPLFRYSCN